MLEQRVSLVTLSVADLARARAFYATLGWREASESQAGVAFYQPPGQAQGLYPLADLARDQGRALTPGSGAMTLAQNVASRAAVDAPVAEAAAAGANVLARPAPTDWRGYVGYFADPDSHVWEVAHVPMFPLAPDGTLTLPGAAA